MELKVEKLETDLEEAFGIIDSLEFELESVGYFNVFQNCLFTNFLNFS